MVIIIIKIVVADMDDDDNNNNSSASRVIIMKVNDGSNISYENNTNDYDNNPPSSIKGIG